MCSSDLDLNFSDYWKGKFPKNLSPTYNDCSILKDAKYMIDMSIIKGDGGGTQYTFLEAIHHDTLLILHNDWINAGTTFKSGYNCIPNDMATSVKEALNVFKRGYNNMRIGLLTPYISEIHEQNKQFLKEFNIVVDYNLNLENDSQTSSVNSNYIKSVIENMLKKENVDVFIIGCSAFNVTSYGYITELEEKFGCNFITSNQALLWYTLHKAIGNERQEDIQKVKGYGKLFSLNLN